MGYFWLSYISVARFTEEFDLSLTNLFFLIFREMNELVSKLNQVGISVNCYALKQRNKKNLLDKLVGLKCYRLASQIALTFDVIEDLSAWSQILNGLMGQKNLPELRNVLESIKNITELWMLPEFGQAWIQVSEHDENFRDMCPIPLD